MEVIVQLSLQPNEEEILMWALKSAVSELGVEIAGTESKELRDDLKERKAVLRGILARLKKR